MAKIKIDGVDVTEYVSAMYDALVGSMDWGSGFLSDDEVEAILIVGELAGFTLGVDHEKCLQAGAAIEVMKARARAKADALKAETAGTV